MVRIQTPVAYQGGKSRISKQITDIIGTDHKNFYDLCCGSGSISIELINRGYNPSKIHMLDAGPWGIVWQSIADKTFSLDIFKSELGKIPKSISEIQSYIKNLSQQPADILTPYVYLILQAGSFGSKAIWINDNKWKNTSFRSYWLPTETSNRRSPVNPMMPMKDTLYERMSAIVEHMSGIKAYHQDITTFIPTNGVVYIDPPYSGTTGYGHSFDVVKYAAGLKCKCYVSEAIPLSDNYVAINCARSKGGISGIRGKANQEVLSWWN
jgi:site-specific DNA-adenine methylase